ncbi:2-hydroxyacid dehydrogenase [Gynuella sp.]|uniref:2-hydroxyacid dehydrogenase n=1 Tax=Gynuella sp. TaxID=2969146 RepID=UPI003D1474B8
MKSVYITRCIPQVGIDLLAQHFNVRVNERPGKLTRQALLENIKDVDGVLSSGTDKIDAELMDLNPGIRCFSNYAVGFDNMDVAAATHRRVLCTNTPDVLTDSTAEMAWALLMAVARRVVESDRIMRTRQWVGWEPQEFLGGDITGKTLGVIGAGRIGTSIAMKSRGFDMEVLYSGRRHNPELEAKLNARFVDMDTLLQSSDFVSLSVALSAQTHHLIGARELALMKSTAYLINTARGPVIDEAALVEALKSKQIAGAGLDVYEFEPDMVEGLELLENTVLTTHIGSATHATRNAMAVKAASNLIAALNGDMPPDCLNPQALD